MLASPWFEEATFYHLFPMGFCGAPEENDGHSEPVERLLKVIDWIPHLQSLGINALYLGPVFESLSHGYDTIDYFKVDRRLGTNETLKKVVKALHENGIKVVLDGVLNHVSRQHFAFKDLQAHLSHSQFVSWFQGLNFHGKSPYGDHFTYEGWSGHFNLVKLNLKTKEVVEHLLSAVSFWVQEFNIDGLRLDAADVMDHGFLKNLTQYTRNIKPEFWLMGEVVHGDYTQWANPEMLHATTNYECYKGLYSSHNDKNYFEIAHSLQRLFNSENGVYKGLKLFNFADNHDVDRVASRLNDRAHLFPLHLLLFTIPGIPSIYYGSEWGLKGEKVGESDAELRPDLILNDLKEHPTDLKDCIARLAKLRQESPALKQGSYEQIHVSSEQLVFKRSTETETLLIAVNASLSNQRVEVPVSGATLKDVLNHSQNISIHEGKVSFEIPGMWGQVFKVLN